MYTNQQIEQIAMTCLKLGAGMNIVTWATDVSRKRLAAMCKDMKDDLEKKQQGKWYGSTLMHLHSTPEKNYPAAYMIAASMRKAKPQSVAGRFLRLERVEALIAAYRVYSRALAMRFAASPVVPTSKEILTFHEAMFALREWMEDESIYGIGECHRCGAHFLDYHNPREFTPRHPKNCPFCMTELRDIQVAHVNKGVSI